MPPARTWTVACISAPPYSPPAATRTRPKWQDGGSPHSLPHLHLGPVDQRIGRIGDNRISRLQARQNLNRIPVVTPDFSRNQRDRVVLHNTASQPFSAE